MASKLTEGVRTVGAATRMTGRHGLPRVTRTGEVRQPPVPYRPGRPEAAAEGPAPVLRAALTTKGTEPWTSENFSGR